VPAEVLERVFQWMQSVEVELAPSSYRWARRTLPRPLTRGISFKQVKVVRRDGGSAALSLTGSAAAEARRGERSQLREPQSSTWAGRGGVILEG